MNEMDSQAAAVGREIQRAFVNGTPLPSGDGSSDAAEAAAGSVSGLHTGSPDNLATAEEYLNFTMGIEQGVDMSSSWTSDISGAPETLSGGDDMSLYVIDDRFALRDSVFEDFAGDAISL